MVAAALDMQELVADQDFLHALEALREICHRDDAHLALNPVCRTDLADDDAVLARLACPVLLSHGWR